jgi:thiamine-phosphate diphosphorylase
MLTAIGPIAAANPKQLSPDRRSVDPTQDRTQVSGLYGMVDTSANKQLDHLTLGCVLLDAGVRFLQLRMKGASDEEHLAILPALQEMCASRGAQLLVNDRLEVAAQVDGVGVHLGQEDADPVAARSLLGGRPLIGLSTHNPSQARAACRLPVDYIGYGPIFSAMGKHHSSLDQRVPRHPVGLASLKQAVAEATVPVVAIGGIKLEHLPLLLATGVQAAAVISAVTSAADCSKAAQAFQQGFAAMTPSA